MKTDKKLLSQTFERLAKTAPDVPPHEAETISVDINGLNCRVANCRQVFLFLAKKAKRLPTVKSLSKPQPVDPVTRRVVPPAYIRLQIDGTVKPIRQCHY